MNGNRYGIKVRALIWSGVLAAYLVTPGAFAVESGSSGHCPNRAATIDQDGSQRTTIVDTFSGPEFDLPGWVDSATPMDQFNRPGRYTMNSPYRGLRRTIGAGSFECLYQLTNIRFDNPKAAINVGFIPLDPRSKVILQVGQSGIGLIFRDRDAQPIVDEKYKQQGLFETPPKSIRIKFIWNRPRKQWRIFYGADGAKAKNELACSRAGLYVANELDITSETLVFMRFGSADVDHFELGPVVKGPQYYADHSRPRRHKPPTVSQQSPGMYCDCAVEPSADGKFAGAEFRVWIPDGLAKVRGVIVRQHGAGASGKGFAHDLQFQALAKKHGFALMGTFMKASNWQGGNWADPHSGSGLGFLTGLKKLAAQSGYPELEQVPWVLWGHSAGGHWVNKLAEWKPQRVIAVVSRSGRAGDYSGAAQNVPNLQIVGVREVDKPRQWYDSQVSAGGLRAAAIEPDTGHACKNSRLLAVAFIEAIIAKYRIVPRASQPGIAGNRISTNWFGDVVTGEIGPGAASRSGGALACWLPGEEFARKWQSFVEHGCVRDDTPPPRPFDLTTETGKNRKPVLRWRAEADIETGIAHFNIYRNGRKIDRVYGQRWNRGDEPVPIDCVMAWEDSWAGEAPDELAKPEQTSYRVSSVNFAALESEKSVAVAAHEEVEKEGKATMSKVIRNNTDWRDTQGRAIAAHDGGISRFAGKFYWYGTSYANNPKGRYGKKDSPWDCFNVYSSDDLVNWHYEGAALSRPQWGWGSIYTMHRAHVLYNEKTHKYVMWFFLYFDYPASFLMVAVSDSPVGPFEILGPSKTGGPFAMGQDMNLFKDDDGKAYVIYDDGTRDLRVDLLTDDYLESTGKSIVAVEKVQEAPAMAKYKGKYIVAGSGVRGWSATETHYAVASSPLGPYGPKKQMSEQKTWGAQITDFVHVPESDTLMAMCDRWWNPDKTDLNKSTYLWLPVTFDPKTESAKMQYRAEWNPFEQ